MSDVFDLQEELDKRDVDGKRLGDELEKIGYLGDAKVGGRNILENFMKLTSSKAPYWKMRTN